MCLFESQILFYQRAETAGVSGINALNYSLKRVWLVPIATILNHVFSSWVQSHTIDLSSPYLNNIFGPLQPIEPP